LIRRAQVVWAKATKREIHPGKNSVWVDLSVGNRCLQVKEETRRGCYALPDTQLNLEWRIYLFIEKTGQEFDHSKY
jgi:hypothetical protein